MSDTNRVPWGQYLPTYQATIIIGNPSFKNKSSKYQVLLIQKRHPICLYFYSKFTFVILGEIVAMHTIYKCLMMMTLIFSYQIKVNLITESSYLI